MLVMVVIDVGTGEGDLSAVRREEGVKALDSHAKRWWLEQKKQKAY